ncbi:MAG: zinc-dependent metalloprotease [Candidatus Limnocylindrales bacterium]
MARIVPALSRALDTDLPGVVERLRGGGSRGLGRGQHGLVRLAHRQARGGPARPGDADRRRPWVGGGRAGQSLDHDPPARACCSASSASGCWASTTSPCCPLKRHPGACCSSRRTSGRRHAASACRSSPFRTWIALHETTHAFEFEAHPWLRPYLAERLERQLTLFGSDARAMARDAIRGLGRALRGEGGGGHWMERLMGDEQRRLFRETQAVMSLLEGFSDYVMDEVGRELVPDVALDQRPVP